jgi:hypothetical protein
MRRAVLLSLALAAAGSSALTEEAEEATVP